MSSRPSFIRRRPYKKRSYTCRGREIWRSVRPKKVIASEGSVSNRQDNAASSSTSLDSNNDVQIPGYHYDPVTKRYFRVLSDSNGCSISNSVTNSTVACIQAEDDRQTLVNSMLESKKKSPSNIKRSRNIVTQLNVLERGGADPVNISRNIRRDSIASIHPVPRLQLKMPVYNYTYNIHTQRCSYTPILERDSQILSLKACGQAVVCCWRRNNTIVTQNLLLSEKGLSRCNSTSTYCRRQFFTKVGIAYEMPHFGFVASNWLSDPYSSDEPDKHLCVLQSYNETVLVGIQTHNPIDSENYSVNDYATNCLDCYSESDFVLGVEDGIVRGKNYVEQNHIKSNHSVIAVFHSRQSPDLCYGASKNRKILLYDERNRSSKIRAVLNLPECSASNLHLSRDENLLTVADVQGKIRLYDTRMLGERGNQRQHNKFILSYSGHVNEGHVADFGVDAKEEIMYAVGSDGVTRVWDFRSAELLTCLPPPTRSSPNLLPNVAYFPTLAHSRPGFIMGVGNVIVAYSI